MRSVILLDIKIDKDEALALLDDYSEFIEKHTGIKHEFWVERRDFSQVPTVVESDGDLKPSPKYRSGLVNEVHSRYGDDGTDNVVMWVHEDNFLYKGIWGQNWSYLYKTYSLQLCRWDKDNPANTFGTLYHEQMHSFDRVVLEEIGVDVNKLFGYDWDAGAVHGAGDWDYIGRKTGRENIEALEQIAPYLARAYAARKERHLNKIDLMTQVISLLSTVVSLLSKKIK